MSLTALNTTNRKVYETRNKRPSKRLVPRVDKTYRVVIVGDDTYTSIPTHYVKNSSGGAYIRHIPDCPICERNERLAQEYPDDYKNKQEFSPISTRVAILVKDITEYRYCKHCGVENDLDRTKCWKCNKNLDVEPEEANVLKALVLSHTQALSLSQSLADFISASGADFGQFFTVVTAKRSSGNKKVLSFTHIMKDGLSVELEQEFDPEILAKYAVTNLTREEIVDFLSGDSLRDIFARRNRDGENGNENTPENAKDEVKNIVDELFG